MTQSYSSYFRRGTYDPHFVLKQIAAGFPNMSEADRAMALEEACHALAASEQVLREVTRSVKKLAEQCGYEVD
jgi:hypothetical protein